MLTRRRLLWLSTITGIALCPLLAQNSPDTTLTINMNGTIGAVLSGTDPLGASGEAGVLTMVANESLSPTKTTATSATYTLPPGAITVTVGGTTVTTTTSSTLKISIPAKGGDNVILSASVRELGIKLQVTATAALRKGSFPSSALQHPTTFHPTPQNLTTATSPTGPGSKISYTALGTTTVLGFSGTASCNAAADEVPEDDDPDFRIDLRAVHAFHEGEVHFRIQRVQGFRPVEGYPGDSSLRLVENGLR